MEHEAEFTTEKISERKINIDYEKPEPSLHMFASMANTRDEIVCDSSVRIRLYLETFIDYLLHDENFKYDVSSWDKEIFLLSAQLHDIGKLAVADNILNKVGKLSEDDYETIKSHAKFGIEVVEQLKESVDDDNLLLHAESMVGSHHEKWDGTGYPQGLKGTQIPLQGRIMSIVDVYYALTSDRPHRKKKSHEEAIEIITEGKGTDFDPDLVDVFLECAKDFAERKN